MNISAIKASNNQDIGIDLNTFDEKAKQAEIARFKDLKPSGWQLYIRLYVPPAKTSGGILLPDSTKDEQKYLNFVGLVVAMSKGAYKDDRYKFTGPYCKVGDWVNFPRHAGYLWAYDNIPMYALNEDVITGVIDNPKHNIPLISK